MERSAAHPAHGLIAVDVVPNRTDGLLERPGLTALPLEVVAPEVITKHLPRGGLECVPSSDEVEGWVSGSEAAHIEDSDQTPVGHQHVAGNQIAVCHDVGCGTRQLPHHCPQLTKSWKVENLLTLAKACLDPGVVRLQVTATTLSTKRPAASVDCADACHELSEVMGERNSGTGVVSVATMPGSHVCTAHGSGYPTPGTPIATGSGVENRVRPSSSARSLGFRFQRTQHRPGVRPLKREPSHEPVTDPKDGVHRSLRIDGPNQQASPRRELFIDQLAHSLNSHGQLAGMHVHLASVTRLDQLRPERRVRARRTSRLWEDPADRASGARRRMWVVPTAIVRPLRRRPLL